MKNIVIIGAGGCGREVLQIIKDINRVTPTWNIKGFIDDNANALDGYACDYGVIGTIKEYQPQDEDVFICALGSPAAKEIVTSKLSDRGAKFVNVIHPTALVFDYALLGKGIIMYPYSIVSANTKVGDHVLINMHSVMGHDASVGSYSTICSLCDITGHVQLGNKVFLGSKVSIVPSLTVGDGAFICAGSIVMSRVKADTKVLGYPARRITL